MIYGMISSFSLLSRAPTINMYYFLISKEAIAAQKMVNNLLASVPSTQHWWLAERCPSRWFSSRISFQMIVVVLKHFIRIL